MTNGYTNPEPNKSWDVMRGYGLLLAGIIHGKYQPRCGCEPKLLQALCINEIVKEITPSPYVDNDVKVYIENEARSYDSYVFTKQHMGILEEAEEEARELAYKTLESVGFFEDTDPNDLKYSYLRAWKRHSKASKSSR